MIKHYKSWLNIKNKLVDFWYWLMKPIAYFFTTEKVNKRYNKRITKLTELKAMERIAKQIIKKVIKYNHRRIIFICDSVSDDDFWNGCTIDWWYDAKGQKLHDAFAKLNMNAEVRENIIGLIKDMNIVNVEEKVEKFTWQHITNYKKTYIIKPK
jgi:hypothetical protein